VRELERTRWSGRARSAAPRNSACAILPTQIYSAPLDLMAVSQPANGIVPMAELEENNHLNARSPGDGDRDAGGAAVGHWQDDASTAN